jgi:hypothetical protein
MQNELLRRSVNVSRLRNFDQIGQRSQRSIPSLVQYRDPKTIFPALRKKYYFASSNSTSIYADCLACSLFPAFFFFSLFLLFYSLSLFLLVSFLVFHIFLPHFLSPPPPNCKPGGEGWQIFYNTVGIIYTSLLKGPLGGF